MNRWQNCEKLKIQACIHIVYVKKGTNPDFENRKPAKTLFMWEQSIRMSYQIAIAVRLIFKEPCMQESSNRALLETDN